MYEMVGTGSDLCVLYPSGTDLRTRMPTLMSRDCTWSGTVGFSGRAYSSMSAEDEGEPAPTGLKKDLIEDWFEGWNWRLRTCAMVVVYCAISSIR